jgi:hypothetical protein
MVQLLVDVFCPGNGKTYEFRIDGSMPVSRAKEEIIANILDSDGAVELSAEGALLCDAGVKSRLAEDASLVDAGVRSGHRLIIC